MLNDSEVLVSMNPIYRTVIVCGTLGALAVKAYDEGKTSAPPANVVGQMLSVTAVSTASVVSSSTATVVVANTITGAIHDTRFGHSVAGDAPSRDDFTSKIIIP
jgi:hypothetical protein